MRPKILDLFLFKNFLKTYFFVVLAIIMIICMIDYTEKVDDFIEHEAPRDEILRYYANFILYYANYLSPLMVFIATVFFTSRLAARTEIIAMLSSGVSFFRIMWPYMAGASVLGALTFYVVGWVLPNANKARIDFEVKYTKDQVFFDDRNVHLVVAPNVYAYIESYVSTTKTGNLFTLETIKGNKLTSKLSAKKIAWDEAKRVWTLKDYEQRILSPGRDSLSYGTDKDTVLNLTPADFDYQFNLFETFSLPALNNYIELIKSRGAEGLEAFLIEKYTRFTQPFAMLILTAIGIIVSGRKTRRGAGWQIALGFLLTFIYILFYLLSKGIAEAGNINPLVAVWLPNIVFTLIGLILFKSLPR